MAVVRGTERLSVVTGRRASLLAAAAVPERISSAIFSRGTALAPRRAMRARPARKPLTVMLVSNNEETLEGVRAYFASAGVVAHTTQLVRDLSRLMPTATAVVVFPDDFDREDVPSFLVQLRRRRPRVLILVVTRGPERFEAALAPDGRSILPIVLPKPSFGWSILDAIRGHAASHLERARPRTPAVRRSATKSSRPRRS